MRVVKRVADEGRATRVAELLEIDARTDLNPEMVSNDGY